MATDPVAPFAPRLLNWFDHHGRRDLPWQQPRTPYRVWLSEIMLQQTRVETVIPYFERFVRVFPDIATLARATLDEVLHLWAGLGYYARARNLHRTATILCARHGGELPDSLDALTALPGIGRSTAGAILAMAWQRRAPILDGNVRRVLARHRAIPGWPGDSAVAHRLWALADDLTPTHRVADYTQAIMDLGATLCTRSRPACERCPLASDCLARQRDSVARYPTSRPARSQPVRHRLWLVLRSDDGQVLLERRPPSGLWGGLWTFPECSLDTDLETLCEELGCTIADRRPGPTGTHVFTHFRLDYQVLEIDVRPLPVVGENTSRRWIDPAAPGTLGLPAPVQQQLQRLAGHPTPDKHPAADEMVIHHAGDHILGEPYQS